MTPVFLLSDGYVANAAEPWKIPDMNDLSPFPTEFRTDPEGFMPYLRDRTTLSRPWVKPGTPGMTHRIGGIEKDYGTGNISYDPANHQRMTEIRAAKINGIANDIPEIEVMHDEDAELLVVGWGSTYSAVLAGVQNSRLRGHKVAYIHLRYLYPFARNLGEILARYPKVLVPELNRGQLARMRIDSNRVISETDSTPFQGDDRVFHRGQ